MCLHGNWVYECIRAILHSLSTSLGFNVLTADDKWRGNYKLGLN